MIYWYLNICLLGDIRLNKTGLSRSNLVHLSLQPLSFILYTNTSNCSIIITPDDLNNIHTSSCTEYNLCTISN